MKKVKNKDIFINVVIIVCFFILLCKSLISTYLINVLTLIPSVIIFVWFIIRFFTKKIQIKSYDIFFAIMLLVGTISGFINSQRVIAIAYQIKALGVYYLLFMIMRNIDLKGDFLKRFLKIMNITTVVLVICSIVEIITFKDFLFPASWADEIVYADNFIRAYSLICNPNIYAFYLVTVLIYNYKFGKIEFNAKSVIFYSLVFTGIVLSISRSGYIALVLVLSSFLLMIIKNRKNKELLKNVLPLCLFVLMATVLLVSTTNGAKTVYKDLEINKATITDKKPNNNTTDPLKKPTQDEKPTTDKKEELTQIVDKENLNAWSRVISMFSSKFLASSLYNGRFAIVRYGISVWNKHKLLGTGFSSFLSASSFLNPNKDAQKLGLDYADNQYITIFVETGLIGTFAFVLTFILLLIEMMKNNKYSAILLTLVVAFFGVFINVLEVQIIAYLYFLYIGLDFQVKTKKEVRK